MSLRRAIKPLGAKKLDAVPYVVDFSTIGSHSFTFPSSISSAKITIIGGGGSGGSGGAYEWVNGAGGGGGSGAMLVWELSHQQLIELKDIAINMSVGAGGAAPGSSGNAYVGKDGYDGQASTLIFQDAILSAGGGERGKGGTYNGQGAPGVGGIFDNRSIVGVSGVRGNAGVNRVNGASLVSMGWGAGQRGGDGSIGGAINDYGPAANGGIRIEYIRLE